MYITEIEITDLRSFSGTHRVSLAHGDGSYAGWTVFAGRNGAGKSSLLKAIALCAIGPLASRSLAGVFTGWVCTGASTGAVAVKLACDSRDEFASDVAGGSGPFWAGLQWSSAKVSKSTRQTSDHLDRWTNMQLLDPKQLADSGPWATDPKGWFIAGYGPYRHLGSPPAEVLKLSGDPVLARLVNLFNETATLSEAVDWLKQVHLRSLEQREGAQALKSTVLAILGDGLLPDGSKILDVDSDGLWIERDGVKLPLEHVSDGYRTVAALVLDILQRLYETYGELEVRREADGKTLCTLPGVVLIDEVDAHLHVAWQQQIGFWLTRTFPAIQFLVTTHSPFICQAASFSGIIRLPAPGDTRKAEAVSEHTWNTVVNGGADEAVESDLFGLEHAHSQLAENLRSEMAELEARLIRGELTDPVDLARYDVLKIRLGESLSELADRKLRALLGGKD